MRAVLGQLIFVYIHPYMEGNRRMGRYILNAMLVSGGYPWTVIPVITFGFRKDHRKLLSPIKVPSFF